MAFEDVDERLGGDRPQGHGAARFPFDVDPGDPGVVNGRDLRVGNAAHERPLRRHRAEIESVIRQGGHAAIHRVTAERAGRNDQKVFTLVDPGLEDLLPSPVGPPLPPIA